MAISKRNQRNKSQRCYCGAIPYPHREGSASAKHGACVKAPDAAERMYEILNRPVRHYVQEGQYS